MPAAVALVADVGESFGDWAMGDDDALLPLLTDANVACGFHAGDPRVMDRTVAACAAAGVSVGAHPGFPDLVGFGRRAMDLSPDEVRTDALFQIGALTAIAGSRGVPVRHVSPHGRLANLLVDDAALAAGFADAVLAADPALAVVTQEGALAAAARERGLAVALLLFADRGYLPSGALVPRRDPGALLHDPEEVAARAVRAVTEGVVRAATGEDAPVAPDGILLHGDTAEAVAHARAVRRALDAAGVRVASLAAR